MTSGAVYDAAADAWAAGPQRVYAALAEAMLDVAPVALPGANVLDVGSGTGVAARAALDRGAVAATAVDLAVRMLQHRDRRVAAVVADATRLPFGPGRFDLVVSAFCLSHLDRPAAAVAEARRVGGAFLASAFAAGPEHPAKAAVDEVMQGFGFQPPAWYADLKARTGLEDPAVLGALARDAGFREVTVDERVVDVGLRSPQDLVDWRWGMAHLAPWVLGLDPETAARARTSCLRAVAGMLPVRLGMLVLSAR